MKLHHILKLTQTQLFEYLACRFPWAVIAEHDYIYVPGNIPLMLVAHLDTVHKDPVKTICTSSGGKIIMSPQGIGGDDRCGVWGLLQCYGKDSHPHLLFTCDEETGGMGAEAFALDWLDYQELQAPLKLIIELDRKGCSDAVYYDCYCPELEEYITGLGYTTEFGTFSDISILSPAMKVPSVNLSIGYYNAHTLHEYINLIEMYKTIQNVKKVISEIDSLPFFVCSPVDEPEFDWPYDYESSWLYRTKDEDAEWYQYYKSVYGKDWDPKWMK